MSVRTRLFLLFAVLTLLPAVPAAWVTHALLARTVDIGLRQEMDDALEAGVRQTRAVLEAQRESLAEQARMWARSVDAAGGELARVEAGEGEGVDPAVRVTTEDGRVLAAGDATLARPTPPTERGAPPHRVRETIRTAGHTLVLEAVVDPAWREDALRTSQALQLLRSMRAERQAVERSFLWPFVLIHAIALLVALGVATLLARGWTRRIDRLVEATDAVAAGNWSTQVGLGGRDELARLGHGFDRMVRTLDAQNRHLVDMETMAGWREMARALAHEVKNPLTPIQLTVEEMRERYHGDDADYRELLDECTRIVVEEVESLRQVVGRFRDFSRPVELEPVALDPNALLHDVGALQRDLHVHYDLADDLPAVRGDADRLRQLLMNLASNSREATAGRDGARLGLSSRRVHDGVALVFEDDGPGIAPEQRDRVFEPYRTGKKAGLGLGLALVKGIVLAHGGRIEVDEGRWGGARFTIVLPVAPESGANVGPSTPSQRETGS